MKMPFYNVLNMLLTGLVFLGGCIVIYPNQAIVLFNNPIVKNITTGPEVVFTLSIFAVTYELGLIINRIGSVIFEPLLKKSKLINFNNDYAKFNLAKERFPIMETLSREYALSRTGISLFIILAVIACLSNNYKLLIIFMLITIIYLLSCRKHSKKIIYLINEYEEENKKVKQNDTAN